MNKEEIKLNAVIDLLKKRIEAVEEAIESRKADLARYEAQGFSTTIALARGSIIPMTTEVACLKSILSFAEEDL